MNENTAKLIEQLAQKLGTTSEYLWRVLLKQAAIDATTTLIQFLVVILFGIILWKIHKKLMKVGADNRNGYYNYEELAAIPMISGVIIFSILLIICFCCIGDIINGYLNPEYWALKTVLNSIR